MLKTAWNAAREWAVEARRQQAAARQHAQVTLCLAALAAILAGIAVGIGAPSVSADAQTPTATLPLGWPSIISLVAGFIAAAAALFGRFVQQGSADKKWVAARAAAEVSQSQCFRYAARVAPYSGIDDAAAALLLDQNVEAAGKMAHEAGAVPRSDPSARVAPPQPMDAAWYRTNRLEDQRQWYRKKSAANDQAAGRLRLLALTFGLIAAALGLAGAMQGLGYLTAGVGAVTTIAGGIAAYSNVERHAYLAASYSGMASAIASLLGRHEEKLLTDAQLVDQGETLMAAEYAAWTQRTLGSSDKG